MPTFTGRKVATPLVTTKTPSVSFFFWSEAAAAAGVAGAARAAPAAGRCSFGTGVFSRTVSAMIGMASAFFRVSVMIRAVADRSGRTSEGGLANVISTS